MERNIKVSRAFRSASWVCVFAVALFLVLFVQEEFFPAPDSNPRGPLTLTLIFLAFVLLNRYMASAAREKKSWARRVSQVLAILMLPFFPIWTGFGIYILKYAYRPWIDRATS